MNYLLDTNSISYLLRGEAHIQKRFLNAGGQARFLLCPVVDYEIRRYLLLKGATRNLAQYESLVSGWLEPAFDAAHWQQAAEIWATLHRAGRPIADADLLIAVTALRQDATFVTHNTRHFLDLGLRLEDWRK